MAVSITKLEAEGLKGVIDSDFRDGNHPVGCPVWTWSANPFKSKTTFSGVVASLVAKGLVHSETDGPVDDRCITMKAEGLAAYEAHIGKAWDAP